ncbi:MAG TPA: hypothetical protein VJB05_02710 [archaeon]|nr:hypothetical protein [archaeon]
MSIHYETKESGQSVAMPDEFSGTSISAVRSRDGQRMVLLGQRTWLDLYLQLSFTAQQYLDSATSKIDTVDQSVPIGRVFPNDDGPFLVEYHPNRIILRTMSGAELSAYFDTITRTDSF